MGNLNENKKSVIILQSSNDELFACKKALKNEFNVLSCLTDGEDGIAAIEQEKPNFLITSIMLRGVDGFEVIKAAKEKSPDTKIIVLNEGFTNETINKSISTNADYCMLLPVKYDILIERMKDLGGSETKNGEKTDDVYDFAPKGKIDERLSSIFLSIGIPASIKGYDFLREAVKLAVKNHTLINSITKKLYPQVAELFKTTASKVERAIRHAIEVAWNKGRMEILNSLFGVKVCEENEKPTNSEFIALITERLLLDGYSYDDIPLVGE